MGKASSDTAIPIEQAFTPAEPIRTPDRYQGRARRLERAHRVLQEPGRHLLILGEPGVGRTSFALTAAAGRRVRYHAVGLDDSFDQILARLLSEDGQTEPASREGTAWDLVNGQAGPADVIIIDDLDRATPDVVRQGITPLLRALSDSASVTKVVLVARRDRPFPNELSGAGLRLYAVVLERLDEASQQAIVQQGARACGISFAAALRDRIVFDADGLPGLVHALALEAARSAADKGRGKASLGRDYLPALEGLVGSLEPPLVAAYQDATAGRSRRNRYAHLLWAAALSHETRFGLEDLERGLAEIEGQPVSPQAFAVHLGDLLKRGLLLRLREGYYRFTDPAMRAYVRLLLRRDHPALMGDDPLQLALPY